MLHKVIVRYDKVSRKFWGEEGYHDVFVDAPSGDDAAASAHQISKDRLPKMIPGSCTCVCAVLPPTQKEIEVFQAVQGGLGALSLDNMNRQDLDAVAGFLFLDTRQLPNKAAVRTAIIDAYAEKAD